MTTATAPTVRVRSAASATTVSASRVSTGPSRSCRCKFLSSGGSGSTTGAINSINYALTIPGLKIMSNSWGGGGYSARP